MIIAAVILAGGTGKRLGSVDKSEIRIQNKTLLRNAVEIAQKQTETVLVSHPARPNVELPDRFVAVPDKFDEPVGPLGGICSCAEWQNNSEANKTDFLMVMPVDTPRFPDSFIKKCSNELHDHDVVVAAFGKQTYPVCSLWRLEAALDIRAHLVTSQGNSIMAFLDTKRSTVCDFAPLFKNNPFENINKISHLLQFSEAF